MRYIFKISFARFLPLFLLVNSLNLPVKSSSSLAAWSLGSDGVLEIRTKSNSRLKAYCKEQGLDNYQQLIGKVVY
mgnify:CR=1 FL=1